MPGSLNYSPSGSEGGRSLGGGDLEKEKSLIGVDLTTTPGTTPLKWRKQSSGGSSGGRSVSVVEGCNTPASTKAPGGQDRVPPRTATRKPSRDPTKAPGAAAEMIDDPVRTVEVPAASSTRTTNGNAKASSIQGNVTPSGTAPLTDRETDDATNLSVGLGHADRRTSPGESDQERCHKNPPLPGRASAAAAEIAEALAKGAVAHSQDVASGSFQQEQEGQRLKRSQNENVAEPIARDDDVQRQNLQEASEQIGANTAIRGETSAKSSSSSTADESHNSINPGTGTAAGVGIDQLGNDLSIENASPVTEGNRAFIDDDGRGSDDHNTKSNNNLDGGSPRTTLAPSGELGACADSDSGGLQQLPADATAVEGEKMRAKTNPEPPSEAGSRVQGGKYRSQIDSSDVPRQDRKGVAGGREVRDAGWDEMGGEGDRAHAPLVAPESEAEGVTERDRRLSSSVNQDLLQSPPMLSRRRTSGRASESAMSLNTTEQVGISSGERERVGGYERIDNPRLDYPGGGGQDSTALGPPPLTPRRQQHPTRTSATERISPAVPPTPCSPLAAAARVVSQEESIRSTLRMKRAAEAIALEDARRIADAKRQEQRRKPSGNRPTSPAPLEHEGNGENVQEEDDDEEEEARARHAEKMRVRALRAMAARQEAEVERDRALELTLEVLRRKQADKRRGVGRGQHQHQPAPGRKRTHSPPRRRRRPRDHRTNLATSVKDSAARSCGLSPAQVVLLRRSRHLGGESNRGKTPSGRRREELAEPKEERPATRIRNPATEALVGQLTKRMTDKEKRAFLHACLEDARECTHRPRTRSAAARRAKAGEGSGERAGEEEQAKDGQGTAMKRDAFLYRVDAQERAKTAAMEHRRGELAYKAVLDKRVCPGCGAEQSYDEVQEKRKTCPNCEVEYRKPKTWAGVRKDFLKRVEEFQESKRQALQSANDFKQTQMRMLALGGIHFPNDAAIESASEMEERERLFWEDIEADFVARLQEDAARRQESLKSRSAALYEELTFQPTLSPASQRVVRESPWTDMTFLERMEGDLQRRREAVPEQQCSYSFGDSYVFDG